jgi:hypothetical protein
VTEYVVDQGYLAEVPAFNPIVYTTVFGPDIYYECLHLLLLSLITSGRYNGRFCIFSDRTVDQIMKYVPRAAQDRVLHVSMDKGDWIQRYNVRALPLETYAPILYLDNDIIIDRDISPLLQEISSQRQVCVTTESDIYPDLSQEKISRISDERRIGNWWGLELIRADKSCSEERLPLANSGIIGFSDYSVFSLVGRLVSELYIAPSHASIAKWFADQPFLNYVLVKTKVGEYEVLRNSCNFLGPEGDFPKRRGFAHFVWARNEEKLRRMKQYLQHLDGHAHEEVPIL